LKFKNDEESRLAFRSKRVFNILPFVFLFWARPDWVFAQQEKCVELMGGIGATIYQQPPRGYSYNAHDGSPVINKGSRKYILWRQRNPFASDKDFLLHQGEERPLKLPSMQSFLSKPDVGFSAPRPKEALHDDFNLPVRTPKDILDQLDIVLPQSQWMREIIEAFWKHLDTQKPLDINEFYKKGGEYGNYFDWAAYEEFLNGPSTPIPRITHDIRIAFTCLEGEYRSPSYASNLLRIIEGSRIMAKGTKVVVDHTPLPLPRESYDLIINDGSSERLGSIQMSDLFRSASNGDELYKKILEIVFLKALTEGYVAYQ